MDLVSSDINKNNAFSIAWLSWSAPVKTEHFDFSCDSVASLSHTNALFQFTKMFAVWSYIKQKATDFRSRAIVNMNI